MEELFLFSSSLGFGLPSPKDQTEERMASLTNFFPTLEARYPRYYVIVRPFLRESQPYQIELIS